MFSLEDEDVRRRRQSPPLQVEKIAVEKIQFPLRFFMLIKSVSQIFQILMRFWPNAQRFATGFLSFFYISSSLLWNHEGYLNRFLNPYKSIKIKTSPTFGKSCQSWRFSSRILVNSLAYWREFSSINGYS